VANKIVETTTEVQ